MMRKDGWKSDWRDNNDIPVGDQGQLGASTAFATARAIEQLPEVAYPFMRSRFFDYYLARVIKEKND